MERFRNHVRLVSGSALINGDYQVALESMIGGTGDLDWDSPTEYEIGTPFEAGDVLFGKLRPYLAKVWLADRPGYAVGDIHVYRPRLGVVPNFLKYVVLDREFIRRVDSQTYGAKMPRADWGDIREIEVQFPSAREQQTIADFLDRETAQIDAMIEAQQSTIGLLEERRLSLVNSVLNPSDGDHARIPLKHAVAYQEGPGIMAVDFRDEGVPLLRIAGVKGREVSLEGCNYLDPRMVVRQWARFRVRSGDLLISASATIGTVSEVASNEVIGAIPYTGIIRVTPRLMTRDYARWFFMSSDFLRQAVTLRTGATMQHFGPSHLAQMSVELPSPEEQMRRAAMLDHAVAAIEGMVEAAQHVIDLLRERREALITAAVTGRIDPETGIERTGPIPEKEAS